jgi:hypothetical protein
MVNPPPKYNQAIRRLWVGHDKGFNYSVQANEFGTDNPENDATG